MKMIPTLEAGRLTLRPFNLNDAPGVQRLAGDRAIADTTLNIPHPYQSGMAENWIASHEAAFFNGIGVAFAIVTKGDRNLAGAISLMNIEREHQAELGYWIGAAYWNQGICTEAAQAVLKYAFEKRGLIRIHARHLTRNPASGRVMRKLGMLHEGTLRNHVQKWGVFEDVELYGILKEEWEANR